MKRNRTIKNLAVVLILTLIIAGSFSAYVYFFSDMVMEPGILLLASDMPEVSIYELKDGKLTELRKQARGTAVRIYPETETIEGREYRKIYDDERDCYVSSDNLTGRRKDVVRETKVYVRTSATLYEKATGPEISSFAEKGECLDVKGYDELLSDGAVNKYKVSCEGEGGKKKEGYIYSRYTVQDQETANAVYNENGIHDKAVKDKYGTELYGGKAENLDYYPRLRPSIEGRKFCEDARAMYINGQAAVNPDEFVKLIKGTNCNAVVIDIKDGYLAYQSAVAKEYSPSSYKSAYSTLEDYKKGIDAYKETGAYLIGRIVVFNDAIYAKDHPDDCIKYGGDSGWPSAYSRNVWEYNVKLAIEAVENFGFDEIQLDYVRFPESAYEMSKSGKANFRNVYGEEKGQAVQNFCIYAADQIHEAGAYLSVDVFGESAYGYMTAYGQYWAGISNVVDAISAMPYTDHMGVDNSWESPYKTMMNWSKKAKAQQDKIEHPAVARTWITGYNTPHWNPTVDYDAKKLNAQVSALKKAGLTGGFIPWNAASDLAKYKQYKSVWNNK